MRQSNDASGCGRPLDDQATSSSEDRLGLTERETEVLRLLSDGRTNREIGDELFISPETVSVHVTSVMRKLEWEDAPTPPGSSERACWIPSAHIDARRASSREESMGGHAGDLGVSPDRTLTGWLPSACRPPGGGDGRRRQ